MTSAGWYNKGVNIGVKNMPKLLQILYNFDMIIPRVNPFPLFSLLLVENSVKLKNIIKIQ